MLYAPPRNAKSASRGVPQHREAFPSLSIDTADVRWHTGQRLCEWHDEQSGLAAQLDLVSYTNLELTVLYSCGADTYRRQRQHCHQLKAWRSVLNTEEKLIARHAELVELVHARAADVRSLTKYDRLREELMSIRVQFNGRVPPRISTPRCHVLNASWFQSDDDRTEREPHDVAPAYLDLPASSTAKIEPL